MNNIALVLSGGGGKGAYQIGVWKALKESGLDKEIVSVSGTSVGALNAALFIHNNLNVAEEIYLNMSSVNGNDFVNLSIVQLNPHNNQ